MFFLNNFSFSVKALDVSPKKVYVTDNGFTKIFGKISRGILLETLVAQFLYKLALRERFQLFYWHENEEVDFILVKDNVVQPIQVAYEINNEETLEREIKGIKLFLNKLNSDQYRDKFIIETPQIIVYRGEEKKIENMKIITAKKFFLESLHETR
ncbi:DUF4143 domain-containing protein [Sulfolobus sp. E11-6]|uniref:DUF4143 domain-containing protein n=1 Tax=Sulfolobus sp. E11-6 TaxID=2663020 RepID=UPI00138697EC|nr:DUF4143 domain-containing protein [Sulfolobus sp. E11-6]